MNEREHTNRLIKETSPYLLQHAHNPVDWHSWGEEAFQIARAENKPLLLSIGYSACHWCHVMEEESFENQEIARLMNELFVSIKVDREERPDVDQIYMNAVQMMLGHGGWPLTVFLTPELVPFYGGTYFPPEDRYNLPGFPRVLRGVAEAYSSRPDEIAETTAKILAEMKRSSVSRESVGDLSPALLDAAFQTFSRTYDRGHGGFGGTPKFPAAMGLEFLLHYHHRTGRQAALDMVMHTCRRMAEGGMYDQLGGGFHRYSTDAVWLVPHFEKMLYDNALLSRLYLHVYQATGDAFFRRVAEQTLDYVIREMTDERGGFYSTQDADSEGVEGKFFVWTRSEIFELLSEEDARIFAARYGVTAEGNFEGKNILHVPTPADAVARELGVTQGRVEEASERGKKVLLAAREKRIKPGRDEKILTAWNGIMLASFAEAAAILNRPDYRVVAERNARFVLDTLLRDNQLLHTYKDGQAKLHAFHDDYALFASGLLSLYETTGTSDWLDACLGLTEAMVGEFWDEEVGGFFYAGRSGEQLILRTKDFLDNATPSGNSVAADLLLRLAHLTGEDGFQRKAINIFRLNLDAMSRYPSAFGRLLAALDFHLSTPKEIVVVGHADEEDTRVLMREVWRPYLPNKVVVLTSGSDAQRSAAIPLLQDRPAINGQATAYVCENYTCQHPVNSAQDLATLLSPPPDKANHSA